MHWLLLGIQDVLTGALSDNITDLWFGVWVSLSLIFCVKCVVHLFLEVAVLALSFFNMYKEMMLA